jgi:hypothetical protein
MKNLFFAAVLLVSSFFAADGFAQNLPGYYIIEPGTEMSVARLSQKEVMTLNKENLLTDRNLRSVMEKGIIYQSGDVVLVTEMIGDVYKATDVNGRELFFKGKLTPVRYTAESGVGTMLADLKLNSGEVIRKGMVMWVVGECGGCVRVSYKDGREIEVPATMIKKQRDNHCQQVATLTFKKIAN